ncbi:MAG: RHS repeat protein [Candidatus Altiarchaeota archaeon]|nr:RHS repeat protein [Candidatus Altiarchaeota archaeon]
MKPGVVLVCLLLLTTPASAVFKYDANGNMVEDGRFTYEYDGANRLSKVFKEDVLQEQYWYDHEGRRAHCMTIVCTNPFLRTFG